MRFYEEARRRGVFRVAAAYLVIAWLVLEVGHVISMILELPHVTMKVLLGALVLGFPLVVGLSWMFRIAQGNWDPHLDLPESDPAAPAEHKAHEGNGGHGGGHGGGGGGVDPLPIIMGVLTLGALVLLFVNRSLGEGDKGDDGHGEASSVAAPAAETSVAAAVAASKPVTAPVTSNSIAVLPFDNLSGDPGQAFFSDGMAEELRGALASVPGLQVAARTSSNAFRDTKSDVATIGAKLGVAYALEGSVRRSGKVVRISAQLIEAKTGFERWSHTYDRQLQDVFAIQSEIAKQVTDALKLQLLPEDAARLAMGATQSVPAHDAYLRGRQQYDLNGDEAVYRAALAQFDAAIAADPGYAAAHAGRARTLAAIAAQFDDPAKARVDFAAAEAAAQRAVALAPDLADAQSALGYVLQYAKLDLAGAARAYDKSMQNGGDDADILIRYGLFNVRAGDTAKGVAALEKALARDRFNPRVWRALGGAYYAAHRFADALPRQREALRLSPGLVGGQFDLGNSLLMLGRTAEAKAAYAAERQRWGKLAGTAMVEARLDNKAGAAAALKALIAEFGDSAIYQQAQVLAQAGDKAGAIAALNRALAVGDPGLLYLRHDPLLDPLRSEAAFKPLLERFSIG